MSSTNVELSLHLLLFVCLFVVVVVVASTSFIPWGKFGSHYMGKVTAPQSY